MKCKRNFLLGLLNFSLWKISIQSQPDNGIFALLLCSSAKMKKKITWKGAYTFKRSFLSSSIDVDISIDLRTNYNTPWKCSNIINQTCSSIFLFWGFFFSKLKSMVEIFEFTLSNSIFGISVLNWIIVQTSKRMRKFDKKNSYFNYSQCRHCKSLCI